MVYSENVNKKAKNLKSLYNFKWDLEFGNNCKKYFDFNLIVGLIISNNDTLLVLDRHNYKIYEFSLTGEYIKDFWFDNKKEYFIDSMCKLKDGKIAILGGLKPYVIIIDINGNIEKVIDLSQDIKCISNMIDVGDCYYATDKDQGIIICISKEGKFIDKMWSEYVSEASKIKYKENVLYILESKLKRISVLTLLKDNTVDNIKYIADFKNPCNICLVDNNVYVSDYNQPNAKDGKLIKLDGDNKIFEVNIAFEKHINPHVLCYCENYRYLFVNDMENQRILRAKI